MNFHCRIGRFLAVLSVCAATGARAQWNLAGTENLPGPGAGVTHVVQTVRQTGGGGREATLHFIGFEADAYHFRVIDQGSNGRESLAEAMQRSGCLAGVNGGYFHPDFEPVGMLVSDGKVLRGPQRAKLLSGALVVTQHHMKLLRASDPLPGKNALQALQSGPFLVEGGKAVAGLNDVRSARRTAVETAFTASA